MRDLRRLAAVPDERSRASASALAEGARREGLLDVALGTADTPVGRLLVAVSGRGLVRVAFPEEDRDAVLEELARGISPRILESAGVTDAARRELEEFFERKRTRFDVRVDRRLMAPFARKVLAATARIPFGRVRSYREIAAAVGSPRAARAVGNALASNPVPIVVPCHRVIRAGGEVGGYGGGPERKAALLMLEGADVVRRGRRGPGVSIGEGGSGRT